MERNMIPLGHSKPLKHCIVKRSNSPKLGVMWAKLKNSEKRIWKMMTCVSARYSMWWRRCCLWFNHFYKEEKTDSRHESLNRAKDLWVVDQLRKHVGVVVHHLPAEEEHVWRLNTCNPRNTVLKFFNSGHWWPPNHQCDVSHVFSLSDEWHE